MRAMGASISYKYNRKAMGLWMVLLGIPLLIAYGAGLILIIIGAIRMRGSGKASKIRKKGQPGYGIVAFKELEHKERVVLLTKKRVVFYYKLENGLLGRTNERINKKTFEKLQNFGDIIPIMKLDNRAVLDYSRLDKPEEVKPSNEEVDFKAQDPAYKYKYGEVTKRSIIFLSISVALVICIEVLNQVIVYTLKNAQSNSSASFIGLNLIVVDYVLNALLFVLLVIFFIAGISKMSFYGLASKIRKDGDDENKKGTLVPIVNKKNGDVTLVQPNKAIFLYTAKNGLLIQTEQVINKKMFNVIMEKGEQDIPYIELNNYAVIDNKETLGKEPTKLDKIFAFIKKYHIFFWFAVLANIYFFTTELVHSINNGFTDGISIFSLAMYFLTLIYISLMELLEFKGKAGNFAYIMTILFLSCNIVATIATLAIGFMNIGITFVHTSVVNFFGLGTIYFFYIIYKISNSIINSKKAKRLDLDYERCASFGDIISNTYTLFNYIAWYFVALVLMNLETRLFALESSIFITIMAVNIIVSTIFIVKCGIGAGKMTKMKKEDIKD